MRCKNCKNKFEVTYFNQKFCKREECLTAAYDYAKKTKAKQWNKEKKERKEKLKTRADHMNELQKIFNKYIRLRDKDEPCISCGKPKGGGEQAGHYRSVGGNPELRFDENNVHGQCIRCNMHLHGNLIEYRKGLIDRVGLHVVEWLELNHEPKKYTIEEIKELKKEYKQKIRLQEKLNEIYNKHK